MTGECMTPSEKMRFVISMLNFPMVMIRDEYKNTVLMPFCF